MIQLSRMCAVFGAAEFLTASEDLLASTPIQYILLPNGKVKHRRLLPGDRWLEILVEPNDIPWRKVDLPTDFCKPSTNILPEGRKLPRILLEQIISFFRHYMSPVDKSPKPPANSRHRSSSNHWGYGDDFEAAAHIIYNTNSKELRVGVPTQVVSGGRVSFKHDHYDIAQGDILLVDFHSHNSMGAFFSATDDASDEKAVFYSGVVGRLDRQDPEIEIRMNVGKNTKVELEVDDIFEELPLAAFPEEWKSKVRKDTPVSNGFDFNRWANGEYGLGTWWADRERYDDNTAHNPGVKPPVKQEKFNVNGSLKKILDKLSYGAQFTNKVLGSWAQINQEAYQYREGLMLMDEADLKALIRSCLLPIRQYLDKLNLPADKEKFFEEKADIELFCASGTSGRPNRYLWVLCQNMWDFDPEHEDKFTNRRLLGQLLYMMETPAPAAAPVTTPAANPPAATPASLALVGKSTGPDLNTAPPTH